MNDINFADLRQKFNNALLLEADGDLSHLAGPLVEVVDVRVCQHTDKTYTILHVPGGTLPMPCRRAIPVSY